MRKKLTIWLMTFGLSVGMVLPGIAEPIGETLPLQEEEAWEEILPMDSDLEESDPEESDPQESDPEESDPVETDPQESDPEETDPTESDPQETDPQESDPQETDPEESDPQETDPQETDPQETDPQETDPPETDPVPIDISKYSMVIEAEDLIYDGTEKIPVVSISGLTEGEDYRLRYENNCNAGTAAVIAEGLGSCQGTLTGYFEIRKAQQMLEADDLVLDYGAEGKINVQKESGDGRISYTSLQPDVVSVDEYGQVKTENAGIGYVRITAEETANYDAAMIEIKVSVRPEIPTVIASDSEENGVLTLSWTAAEGAQKYQIRASRKMDFSSASEWETVHCTETLKNLSKGKTYYLQVRSVFQTDTEEICSDWSSAVTQYVLNQKLNLKKTTVYLECSRQLILEDAVGTVKWSSSNKRVAKVDKNGVVTGVKKGSATITAKCNGKTYQCKVTVKENVAVYSVNQKVKKYPYGNPSIRKAKVYYKAGAVVMDVYVVNNRMFPAKKFVKLKGVIRSKDGKIIAKKTFYNIRLDMPKYSMKKITVKFPKSVVKQKRYAFRDGITDEWTFSYVYQYRR